MKAALVGALLAGLAIGGCGGSASGGSAAGGSASGGSPSGGSSSGGRLAANDAASLHGDVALIRAAAAAHNAGDAEAAATKLREDVGRLVARGRLSAVDGQLMLRAIAQLDSRIPIELQAPVPPDGGPRPGHGKGHGYDHGQGKGNVAGDGGGDGGD
jgi:hypothetical protein